MSEFLRYVLWELRRYSILVLLAVIFSLLVLWLVRSWYRRKYGDEKRFPWKNVLLFVLFTGYLAIVFFVTNFRSSFMSREVNLHLFRAWREALNNFSQHRWLNVLLNIAMFCPFGFLLPLLGKKNRKWYMTISAGFGFSLFIELLQLLFANGIFDVDDMFCNTLGAAIGYFCVMVFLSTFSDKGKRWKSVLVYVSLTLLSLGSVGSVFLVYQAKEFGNLPQASAYTVYTRGTEWTLVCELPIVRDIVPVYQVQTRRNEDCDAFAEAFRLIIPTEFDDISYYQEGAYYMDHNSQGGAHFLIVNYLDRGYEYSGIYDDESHWLDADRETVLSLLEKYPTQIPESAEFSALGAGWYSFTVNLQVDDGNLFDGTIRVRIAADGSVRNIENGLLSYTYYRDVAVISPQVAYQRLRDGQFNDEGFFENEEPANVSVLGCVLEYRVDTKGFYQPVYIFHVASPDGSYQDHLLIPALE